MAYLLIMYRVEPATCRIFFIFWVISQHRLCYMFFNPYKSVALKGVFLYSIHITLCSIFVVGRNFTIHNDSV